MIFLLLAVISSASIALVLKLFRSPEGNRYGIIIGNYLTCVLLSLIFISHKRAIFSAAPATLICGIAGGVLFVAGLVFLQSSIRVNGAALTSAFSKLGVLVPLVLSFAVFGERPTALEIAGIAVALGALILINSPGQDSEASHSDKAIEVHSSAVSAKKAVTYSFPLLILTFFANGSADSMAKVFESTGDAGEDTIYIFYVFAVACFISLVLAIIEYRRASHPIKAKELLAGACLGVPNYFSSYFLLNSLERLPSFLVYPVFSTGTILMVTLVSTVFFKERPSARQYLAIGLIVLALVLLNI